jgi:hypothetical protein
LRRAPRAARLPATGGKAHGGYDVRRIGGKRVAAIAAAAAGALFGASPAHAWYVDLSISGAGNVYEFTDANELDEHCTEYPEEGFSSPSTTPTGVLGATCRAGDGGGDYGNGWIVEYRVIAAPGYRFDGWRARAGETETAIKCDGASGSTWAGPICRFQIWDNLHTQATFVDDTHPSMSSLNGPTAQVNRAATFTFSAASDPTFSHFQCRLTTGAESQLHDWQTCSSGHQENPAATGTEGTYKLYVRAVDRSQNVSAASSWTWIVDKLAPETSLDSGSGPSGVTKSTSASFAFSSNSGDVAGYTCVLDGVSTTCSSPKTYTNLSDGPHTFSVYARDDAGNDDASPASRTWTVDTTAPGTAISGGPDEGSMARSRADFAFTSTESGTFECQLDGTGYSTCESPRAFVGLSDGEHTFSVRARDEAGNVDGSPATRTWRVDATAPTTTITGGPADGSASTDTSATFGFTASEAGTFECRLNASAFVPCSGSGSHTTSALAPGTYVFEVRATDAVGNVGPAARRTFTVVAPQTSGGGGQTTTGGGVATLSLMDARPRLRYKVTRGRTIVRSLTLTKLPVGATVNVSCKGKGCKFRRKTLTAATPTLSLTKLFKGRKLRAGAVIQVRITAPGYAPKAFRYTTRRGSKAPTSGGVS